MQGLGSPPGKLRRSPAFMFATEEREAAQDQPSAVLAQVHVVLGGVGGGAGG
jgi:hypothetical protein